MREMAGIPGTGIAIETGIEIGSVSEKGLPVMPLETIPGPATLAVVLASVARDLDLGLGRGRQLPLLLFLALARVPEASRPVTVLLV